MTEHGSPRGESFNVSPSTNVTPETPNMSRRGFFKIAGLGATVLGGAVVAEKLGINTTPTANAEPTTEQPHPLLQPEHAAESQEHEAGITPLNLGSALVVLGAFTHAVGGTIRHEEKNFGVATATEVLSAAAARNVAMRFGNKGDKHHAELELKELAKGLGIASGIAGMAETTAHSEIDPEALFNKVRTIGEGLDAEAEQPKLPSLEDGKISEWRDYEFAQKMRAVDTASQNFVMSGVLAPLTTIFTAATYANVMNERLAGNMAEVRYAEAVLEAKKANKPLDEATLRDAANEKAANDMNGADGAVLLSMLNAANDQGVGSAPPFIFYAVNNGVEEWVKTSAMLFVYMNGVGAVAQHQWLAKHLGLERGTVNAQSSKARIKAFPQVLAGIRSSLKQGDTSFHNNKEWSQGLDDQMRSLAEGNTFSPEELAGLNEKLRSHPRVPFQYDGDGLVRALGEFAEDTRDNVKLGANNLTSAIAGVANTLLGKDDAPSTAPEHGITPEDIDEIIAAKDSEAIMELARKHPDSSVPRIIVGHFLGAKQDNRINEMLGIWEDITRSRNPEDLELSEDQRQTIRDAYLDQPDADKAALISNVKSAAHNSDPTVLAHALADLDAVASPFSPGVTREVAERLEILFTKDLATDPHAGTHKGLDHATKDVIAALSTQLGASGPASVVATSLVEYAKEHNMPRWAQNALTLSLTAGLSSFADNIVAYMSGETTLLNTNMPKDTANSQASAAELKKLKNTLTRSAIAVATVAGGNSNIGSMAALKFSAPEPKYDRETGKNSVHMRPLTLGETVGRPYALTTTLLTIFGATAMIEKATPKSLTTSSH